MVGQGEGGGALLAKQDFGGGYWIQGTLNTGIVTNPLYSTVGYQSIGDVAEANFVKLNLISYLIRENFST